MRSDAESSPTTRPVTADVFISYAREDQEFVKALSEALAAHGRRAWVDWADIPPSAEWMDEIRLAIASADSYVFVLSPDSVASKVCATELETALSANKRVVPVLAREIGDDGVPDAVARLNWVIFTDAFEQGLERLLQALNTDLDHLRSHTRLLVRAQEWEAKGRDKALLLRGRDLTDAEGWLAAAERREPEPTALHTRYLLASRRAATRRHQGTISAVTAMFLVAAVLGAVAWSLRGIAVDQRAVAERNAAESLQSALRAQAALAAQTDPATALLLASAAGRSDPDLLESDLTNATMESAQGLGKPAGLDRLIPLGPSMALSPDGTTLAAIGDDGAFGAWDLSSRDRLISARGVGALAIDPTGRSIATGGTDGAVRIWDVSAGELLRQHDGESPVQTLSFDDSGRMVAVGEIGSPQSGSGGYLYEVGADEVVSNFSVGDGHPVYEVAVTAVVDNDRWLSAGYALSIGNVTQFWARDSRQSSSQVPIRTATPVYNMELSPDQQYVALATAGGLRVSSVPRCELRPRSDRPNATTYMWCSSARQVIANVSTDASSLALDWSDNSHEVIIGAVDGTVLIYDVLSGNLSALATLPAPVLCAAFPSNNAQVVVGLADGSAYVLDAVSGEEVGRFRDPNDEMIVDCQSSPEADAIFIQTLGGKVELWNLDQKQLTGIFDP